MASPSSPAKAYDAVAGAQSDLVARELDNLAADASAAARMLLAYVPQASPRGSTTRP